MQPIAIYLYKINRGCRFTCKYYRHICIRKILYNNSHLFFYKNNKYRKRSIIYKKNCLKSYFLQHIQKSLKLRIPYFEYNYHLYNSFKFTR